MRNFLLGLMAGLIIAAGGVEAGSKIYGGKSNPGGPQIPQYDYFRQRQQWLDINSLRRQSDRAAAEAEAAKKYSPYLNAPCAK